MDKKVINVINFIRGCEPRWPMELVTPIKEQLKQIDKLGLKATFLFEYDSLLREDIVSLFDGIDKDRIELGGWFEIVRQQVEVAGLTYRGRDGYDWDHYANVSTPMGYSVEERKLLADEYMRKFKETFGFYPKSVGAWAMDAVTLEYLSEKYNLSAFCVCREQVGTDGYNFSGGYYSGGYYPSKNNMLCPANTLKNQIKTPVFRMLGADFVEQYYLGLDDKYNPSAHQGVITLETISCRNNRGGKVDGWVDWFLDATFDNVLNFAYTQAGQENSFGWEAMEHGITYQFKKIADDSKKGKFEVLTLAETGEFFKKEFKITPPTVCASKTSYSDSEVGAVWFENAFYRAGFYISHDKFLLRDAYIFDENYKERYLEKPLETVDYNYDNLAVINGYLYSGNGILAGIRIISDGKEISLKSWEYIKKSENSIALSLITEKGEIIVTCEEKSLRFNAEFDFVLEYLGKTMPNVVNFFEKTIEFSHRDYLYSIKTDGKFLKTDNGFRIYPCGKNLNVLL